MKVHRFPFNAVQASLIFGASPIRVRTEAIRLLMKAMKHMLVNAPVAKGTEVGEIVLVVSKMSRLFFVQPGRITSIVFPFHVLEGGESLVFRSRYHSSIDSKTTSVILALLTEADVLAADEVFDFAERITVECESDPEIWSLFRHLLLEEDGYIRYDNDPDRVDLHMHPLHHLDLFYSGNATFKLGLVDQLTVDYFRDILDTTSNCHYVSSVEKKTVLARFLSAFK